MMKIDGKNIKDYGAKILTYNFKDTEFDTEDTEWPDGTLVPFLGQAKEKFKQLDVEIVLKGETKELIDRNISSLLALLKLPREIKFDNYAMLFRGQLIEKEKIDTVKPLVKRYIMQFKGYTYGARSKQDFNQSLSTQWKVKGNIPSAATLTITPTMTIQSITITGFSEMPITIRNLKKDVQITLDGEKGLIMENGQNKFKDVDLWEFPRLIPGTQSFGCSHTGLNISIEYNPRFL